ncbi:MAG TPA: N,N-dimethylformamidase beta subunit family domain-containing protein [Pseudonocardiaceae bacterium]|nr:N,N-dimethylformamidase beta subunit family domain-containing protein [Pseudonocardiaceae bacterium]
MSLRKVSPLLLFAVLFVVAACTGSSPSAGKPAQSSSTSAPGTSAPAAGTSLTAYGVSANWMVEENKKPGSPAWRISDTPATGKIEGFASQVYASAGQSVNFYVNTTAPKFKIEAYRVGYYGGVGGRLVWSSAEQTGKAQPPCPLTPGVNMVSCDNWTPSLSVPITSAFVQGDYLFKLTGSDNEQSYVPLTVWDPASHGAYLFKNDVFTWQAWNPYGGYDYYVGPGQCPKNVYPLCTRARVVSYDRPYAYDDAGGEGTGDFLWLELPLVQFMEQHGLDVSYVTDLTVAEHPDILANHKALLSEGHDECWSLAERNAATAANAKGLNLAFFGASGVLRHVRSQNSPLGTDRQLVDYRDSTQDPLNGHGDPKEVTGNTWSAPPASWPETDFVGEAYNGFLEPEVYADLTVADASAWIFKGTGLHNGSVLPGAIGSDVDSLQPRASHPANVQILAHSGLPANQAQPNTKMGNVFFSDMTYYADPKTKAGVWDSGTNNWIPALHSNGAETDATARLVQQITGNLFWLIGQGPAGAIQPSTPNWQQIYAAPPPAR